MKLCINCWLERQSRFGILCITALLALAWAAPIRALPPATASPSGTHAATVAQTDVKFERISVEHGLSESSIYAILQDSQGFIWFGTQDGLNKYDGYDFTVYKPLPAQNSLSHNYVWAIIEEKSGALWIGTNGGGLNHFDRQTLEFTHYRRVSGDPHSLSSDYVRALYQDDAGMLWIGTQGGGLDRLDPTSGQFTHYTTRSSGLSNDSVRVICPDRQGALWIGADGGGLNRFDPATQQFTRYQHKPADPHSLSGDSVRAIYQDRAGALWVGSENGLDRFDHEQNRFDRYDHYSVQTIYQDQSGTLWIGGKGGLTRYDHQIDRLVRYYNDPRNPNSLSANWVQTIYQDREGLLWIGTYGGGLDKLDRFAQRFSHYQHNPDDSNSLGSNLIWAIYQDRQGVLWVGTSDAGLNRFDPGRQDVTRFYHTSSNPHSLSSNSVRAIYQDRQNKLWVGTEGGLDKFDRTSGQFTHYQFDPDNPHSISHNDVRAIYQGKQGTLWLGTNGGGLNKFDPDSGKFTRYPINPYTANGLSSPIVWDIHQDRDGLLWIATGDGGLNVLDPATGQFSHYRADPQDPNSLSHDNVMTMYQDRQGILWLGTFGGGLEKFDPQTETFVHYREQDGLPNDVVYGILQDNHGFLWLSTNRGLSKFDPRTETFRNYDFNDGLQSNEFNAGAYHKSSSGELFFGGINGFNVFYPTLIKDNTLPPPIVLTALQQSGQDVLKGQSLESISQVILQWPNNFFDFEFAALSFANPQKNQYVYMLKGFDKDWNNIGNRRFGRYTNLPGGSYTLRIKGSNNDGVWNLTGATLEIVIVPPFWETWWFRGALVLLLVAGVIGGYRWRVKRIEAYNRELQALVKRRTHEIEQRRQELEALYRADAELHRHLRLDQVLRALVDIVVDILKADKSSLIVWDAQRERLVVRVARGFNPETLDRMTFTPGQGTVGLVAATSQPVIVEDALADDRIGKQAEIVELEGIRSFMQVPIQINGQVFGVFSADYARPHAFGADEQRLFVALAQRAALAIDTAQLYEQTRELAVVEERNRLARDLHDAVTQTLFSASLISQVLPATWASDPQQGQALLSELRQLSRGALAEMRTLLLELRPTALVETSLQDLLRQLTEAAAGREGLEIHLDVQGECKLPQPVHIALYRIAQESLNNVVKHAQATRVTTSLRCLPDDGAAELRIQDDGCGFDSNCIPPDRLGLGIMRERAQAIGATLDMVSQTNCGTQIKVRWQKSSSRKENG